MSTLSGKVTLLDVAKSLDPDGTVSDVAELLSQSNEILTDMTWIEGNLPTGQEGTIRTGIPAGTWRKLYGGVPADKTTRAKVTDSCGMLEQRCEVDKDAVEMANNQAAFRMSEASGLIEGMAQTFAQTLFYGNTDVNPERFLGLSARFPSLAGYAGSVNVLNCGGTGADCCSAWLIGWSPNCVTGIYPKNSKAGLTHEDLGIGDAFDANGNRYRAYMDWFQWKGGLHVKDWRYLVRMCNIDDDDVGTAGISGNQGTGVATTLLRRMASAVDHLPNIMACRPAFYMNRTCRTVLKLQALEKSSSALSLTDAMGQFNLNFLGIPIRTCDALTFTETALA